MTPESSATPSFVQVLAGLNAGDQEAARKLYERFINQLVHLAARKLNYTFGSRADPESVAHSVFESFFEPFFPKPDGPAPAADARPPRFEFHNWEMVFGLLAHITFCKCRKRKRAEMQAKRNPGAPVRPLDEFQVAAPGGDESAMVAELLQKALDGFQADERAAIDAFMGGKTVDAVAQQVGLSSRTVQRIVERFRKRLEALLLAAD